MARRSFHLLTADSYRERAQDDALVAEAFTGGEWVKGPPSAWFVASFPTRAKYWTTRTPQRLRSKAPLPGESKKNGVKRAARAKSYFARVTEQRRRAPVKQWRVKIVGEIEAHKTSGSVYLDGQQFSPWQDGEPTDDAIKSVYYDTARRAISADDGKHHAPTWDATLGTWTTDRYPKATYENAILVIKDVTLETRDAAPDKSPGGGTWDDDGDGDDE